MRMLKATAVLGALLSAIGLARRNRPLEVVVQHDNSKDNEGIWVYDPTVF